LLDIVDHCDQVIGTLSRGEVHARGLMHRSVHVLVFHTDGRLLLQKRSLQKDNCPGMWDSSCAGHVESGADYNETANRELTEELGFKPESPLQSVFKMSPTRDNGLEFAMVFQTIFDGPFVLARDEIDEVRWVDLLGVDQWCRASCDAGALDDSGFPGELTSGFTEIWQRLRGAGQ